MSLIENHVKYVFVPSYVMWTVQGYTSTFFRFGPTTITQNENGIIHFYSMHVSSCRSYDLGIIIRGFELVHTDPLEMSSTHTNWGSSFDYTPFTSILVTEALFKGVGVYHYPCGKNSQRVAHGGLY